MNHPWLDNSVKRPWLAVFLVLLVAVLFSWGAKNLYFRGDFRIFFSADNPQMLRCAGGDHPVLVQYRV